MDAGYNTMKQYIEGSHNEHNFSIDIAIAIVCLLLFLHMPLIKELKMRDTNTPVQNSAGSTKANSKGIYLEKQQ